MGIRNLWTLNVDELLVADGLKDHFSKSDYDVFLPLNSQMKDIDLVLINVKNKKVKTIQVKGSRTYSPRKSEVERYGEGSATWFKISTNAIFNPCNKVDFYVFVLHSFYDGKVKKEMLINYLVIPMKHFQNFCKKKTSRKDGKSYDFFIWIDPKGERAFDMNTSQGEVLPLSKYLNNWSLLSS